MNNPLTQKHEIRYVNPIAGHTLQSGLTARFKGGHTAAFMAVFLFASWPSIWAAMWEAFGPAGSFDRSVNPHGRPFCLTAKRAEKTNIKGGIMKPTLSQPAICNTQGVDMDFTNCIKFKACTEALK